MYGPISIQDIRQALKAVEDIDRPDADNDGDALNSPLVYNYLSSQDQEKVDRAVELVNDYVRDSEGAANNRAVSILNRSGFRTNFNEDQYEPDRYVGSLSVGDWEIDISDPTLMGEG